MRSTIAFLLISAFFFSCADEKKVQTEASPEASQTDLSFEALSFDTVVMEKKLSMYNEAYVLKIKKYSLNDSSIRKEKQVYHQTAAHLTLHKGKEKILDRIFSILDFREESNPDFYEATLLDIQYEGVRTHRLFFKATFNVPDTDLQQETAFNLYYMGEKTGKLEIWDTLTKRWR